MFNYLMEYRRLSSLYDFDNTDGIFPGIHRQTKFCLVTLTGLKVNADKTTFAFFVRTTAEASNPERAFTLDYEELQKLSPITGLCPTFRSSHEKIVTGNMYKRVAAFSTQKSSEPNWGDSDYFIMFRSDSSSELYLAEEDLEGASPGPASDQWVKGKNEKFAPLWEAKLIHQFDHRYASYRNANDQQIEKGLPPHIDKEVKTLEWAPKPRKWVREKDLLHALQLRNWKYQWVCGYRDVTNVDNVRTAIAAILPLGGAPQPLNLFMPLAPNLALLWVSAMNSFSIDFINRMLVGGSRHLNITSCRQLPIPSTFGRLDELVPGLQNRILELVYTAPPLYHFALDCGYDGPPFRWDEDRRFLLRCELDAAFFHLYGIERDDVDYIMETFPIVKRKDEAAHGSYRTKEKILEIYDAMQRAIETGVAYQTVLDPPPADPRVAHPPREVRKVAAALPIETPPPEFPDIAAVSEGAWATPTGTLPESIALLSLVSILSHFKVPVEADRVRLAAILVRKPVLALPFLDTQIQKEWMRVIGAEAQPLPANVVSLEQFKGDDKDSAMADAIRQLKGSGALVEETTGMWSAGGNLLSSGEEWIEGRAAFAVSVLTEIDTAKAEQNIVSFIGRLKDGSAAKAVS